MFYLRAAPVADFSLDLVLSHCVKWMEPGCSLWETTPVCSSGSLAPWELSSQDLELSCCSVMVAPVTPECRLMVVSVILPGSHCRLPSLCLDSIFAQITRQAVVWSGQVV